MAVNRSIGGPGRCVQTAPVRNGADVAKWVVEPLDGLGESRVHLAGNSPLADTRAELGAARARKNIPSLDVQIYPNIGHDLLWANQEVVIPRFLDFADIHDRVRN